MLDATQLDKARPTKAGEPMKETHSGNNDSAMVYYVIRAIFVLLFTLTAWKLGLTLVPEADADSGALVGIFFGVAASILLVGFEAYFGKYYLSVFYSIITGLLLGLLVSVFFVQIIAYIPSEYVPMDESGEQKRQIIGLLITTFVCYFSVVLVMRTRNKYRLVIPFIELKQVGPQQKRLLLDTSVIIDGRIADIAETAIIDQSLYLPDFVLQEIHRVADSSDTLKRTRGKRGLDLLNKLRNNPRIRLETISTNFTDQQLSPEGKLIQMATDSNMRILTTDNNLHRLAQLQGIEVVNLHELENALRPIVLVGETRTVKVLRPGEEPNQGVGYLEDGTMVVVKGGKRFIGDEIIVTVTSILQKQTGRILFAEPAVEERERHNGEPTPSGRRKKGGNSSGSGESSG